MEDTTLDAIYQELENALVEGEEQRAAQGKAAAEQLAALKSCIDALRETLTASTDVDSPYAVLRERLTALRGVCGNSAESLQNSQERVAELEAALAKQEESASEAMAKVQQVEQHMAQNADALAAAQRRVDELEAVVARDVGEADALRARADDAGAARQALSSELSAAKAELEEARGALDELDEARERAEELEQLLARERERANGLEAELRRETADGTKAAIAEQLAHALRELEELRHDLAAARDAGKEAAAVEAGDEPAPQEPPPLPKRKREPPRPQLGNLLVERGAITEDQLQQALEAQQARQGHLGEILVEQKAVAPEALAEALAEQHNLPFIRLTDDAIEPEAVALINGRIAQRHSCIPLKATETTLELAMVDPMDLIAIEDVELASGRTVSPVVGVAGEIGEAISRFYEPAG